VSVSFVVHYWSLRTIYKVAEKYAVKIIMEKSSLDKTI